MAGDLITADYQIELNGVLMGATTPFIIGEQGISGLGIPGTKTADVDLLNDDGAYGAPDYMDVRTLLVHLTFVDDDDGTAFDHFVAASPAWNPSADDVEFHVQLPGFGHIFFTGRARGLDDDMTLGPQGAIQAVGTFVALNPLVQIFGDSA